MATAAKKATSLTTLVIGNVEVPVGLFSTSDKPGKLAEFQTAGPNGGVLKAQAVARAVPVAEAPAETVDQPVFSDPLAVDEPAVGKGMVPEPWSETHATADEAARAGDAEAIDALAEAAADAPSSDDERQATELLADPRGAGIGTLAARDRPMLDPESCGPDWPERLAESRARAAEHPPVRVDGEYGRQLVEDGTGVVVEPGDVRRGVRREDGSFIDCTEQLAEIDRRTKLDRMTVVGFVDVTQVSRARVRNAYYLGPGDEKAPRPLRGLYEGLKRTRRAAVVKVTKKSRQSLAVISQRDESLMLYELVWAEDFRPAPARCTRIQKEAVHGREVQAWVDLISAMGVPTKALDELRDDAIEVRERLLVKALAGEVPEVLTPQAVKDEQDVMAQLEASLAAVA